MIAPALLWVLFGELAWIGLKYRILWDSDSVIQHASGLTRKRIAFQDISHIRSEQAPASEFLSMPRPFRRVAIYGRKSDPAAFIDVSLRHFHREDIRELLAAIHARRPDLKVPTV